MMLPALPLPVVSGPLSGARFLFGSFAGRGAGIRVYLNREIGNPQREAVVKTLHPGQTVLDLGACVGYFSVLASRRVGPHGRVIALEPSLRNLAFLYHHVRLNHLANVTVLSAACSDVPALASFSDGANCALGHLSSKGNCLVPVITVDQIAEGIGQIHAIKIDVEGNELKVLQGARRVLQTRPALFLSVHSDTLQSSCLNYLSGLDYDCQFLGVGEFLCH